MASEKKGARELAQEPEPAPGLAPEPDAVEEPDPVDALSDEDADKLRRGEIAPPEPKAKKEEFVPHEQFHRANERLKEERARAEKAEQASSLAMQRLSELLEASKPQPQPQEPEQPDFGPDPEENPIAWAKWRQQRDMEEEQARRNWQAHQQQSQYQHEVRGRLIDAYARDAIAFKEQAPDWGDAYEHFLSARRSDLQMLGYAPQVIEQMVEQDELSIAYQSLSNGRSAAETLYNLAKARGYQGGANKHVEMARGEGGKFVAAAEAMDKREATKRAAKSLNGAGSTQDDMGELTPEKIVNMSEDEFKAFKNKYGEDAMKVAFGQKRM